MRTKSNIIFTVALLLGSLSATQAFAQEKQAEGSTADGPRRTTEPVFRVSKRSNDANPVASPNSIKVPSVPKAAEINSEPAPKSAGPAILATPSAQPHPLDQALETAHESLANIKANIFDYTAVMVKRERVKNKLGEREFMQIKIRNGREIDGNRVPFSVYMKFLKPRASAGREVVWVKGQNENKLMVHEGGALNFKTFHLDPEGWLAMQNNRYPIYEAGLENLVAKLIEKASRDREAGHCDVEYREGAMINKRPCSLIEVIHNERKAPYDFHKAQVFIDDELQIPVRYAAYDWPAAPGQPPQLLEEYTYVNVELNAGLTDMDFNTKNPNYKFPR